MNIPQPKYQKTFLGKWLDDFNRDLLSGKLKDSQEDKKLAKKYPEFVSKEVITPLEASTPF